MKTLLKSLTDTTIRIEQNNDIGMTGRLINVQTDYASLFTAQRQLVHYPYAHVKSIGINVTELPKTVPIPDVEFPDTFYKLLETLFLQLVRIENGEHAQQGVLASVTEDNVCLILNHRQMVYYPLHQIKSISPIFKIKTDQTTDQDPSSKGGQNSAKTSQDDQASEGNTNSPCTSVDADSNVDSSASDVSGSLSADHAVAEASAHETKLVAAEPVDRTGKTVQTVQYSDETTNKRNPGSASTDVTADANTVGSTSNKSESRSTNHVTFHEMMAGRMSQRSGTEHADPRGEDVRTARYSGETTNEKPPSRERQDSSLDDSNLKSAKEHRNTSGSDSPDKSLKSRMHNRFSTKGLDENNKGSDSARDDRVNSHKPPKRSGKGESALRPCLLNRSCKTQVKRTG